METAESTGRTAALLSLGKASLEFVDPIPKDPAVVWPAAAPLTRGQTLAHSALTGGKADVPGVFCWKEPDTVPGADGSFTVVFTPADARRYNTLEQDVTLTLRAPAPAPKPDVPTPKPDTPAQKPGTPAAGPQTSTVPDSDGSAPGDQTSAPPASAVPAVVQTTVIAPAPTAAPGATPAPEKEGPLLQTSPEPEITPGATPAPDAQTRPADAPATAPTPQAARGGLPLPLLAVGVLAALGLGTAALLWVRRR